MTDPIRNIAPIIGVNQVTTSQPSPANEGTKTPLLKLFEDPTFEKSSGTGQVGLTGVPSLSDGEKEQIQGLFGNCTDEQLAKIMQAGDVLAQAAMAQGAKSQSSPISTRAGSMDRASMHPAIVASGTAAQVSPELSQAATNAIQTVSQNTSNPNTAKSDQYDNAVQGALYAGVVGIQKQLGRFAQTVQGTTDQINKVETAAQGLQDQVQHWGADPSKTETYEYTTVDPTSGHAVTHTATGNEAQAKAALDGMNSDLTTLNSTSQQQQVQLQVMINNYQQAFTALTNMLKTMHDTTMAEISNLKI